MTKLELDLLKLSEGKSLEFAANYAAIIPQIIEVLKAQNTPEGFEQAYSEIFSPIVKRPYPRLENGDYKYIEIDQGWKLWQAATAQAVPEGFVLVPEDQAKDTERLNFLLGGDRYIRTVVPRDIENEDYEKTGEHYLFTELYWIDGWDYHENTSSQHERGAIDKAMIEAQEQCHEPIACR